MSESLKSRIINTIMETQKISREVIDDALRLQKEKGIGIEKILIEKGLIEEKDLLVLLVRELNIPFINLKKYKIDPTLKEVVPERIARQYRIVPISSLDCTMTIAVSDPLNVFAIDDLKNITGKEIDVVMSTDSEIEKVINQFYGSEDFADMTQLTKDIDVDKFEIVSETEDDQDLDNAVDLSEKAPIIRMVNLIIKEALKQRASDIHIEPADDAVRVRYRIDGILHDIFTIPKENQNAVLVRLKVMARLDITAAQTPQDGRFKMKVLSKEVDFRVSLLPTTFGQKIVLRVLDKMNLNQGLEGLGYLQKSLNHFKEAIKSPFGMILVTGPTGSGKSTTLYSIINALNTVDKNIITVEDPVEYMLEGLTQIQCKPEIGLTFAEGLRAILRQSPDVVMVGEIRDNETADIAIKASLTGQLVLSTLHTNDAAGALTRLIDMGVEPFLVASSLIMVSAQRLCRKICAQCKEKVQIPDKLRQSIAYPLEKAAMFYQGKGCQACRFTGYSGRISVAEVLVIDDDIREHLLKGESSDKIKQFAKMKKGMESLWEDAMAKCLSGFITYEEVLRTTTNK